MPNKAKPLKRHWIKERKPFQRKNDNSWFYNSKKWRMVSHLFRSNYPFCKECDKKGITKPTEVADHIHGLNYCLRNDIDPYLFSQLQPLCHKCHNKKSGKESHGKIN